MIIRKDNAKISERELDYVGIMSLSNLCKGVSVERIKYYIQLFNNDPSGLEKYEECFLINYVTKGLVEQVKDEGYALYLTGSGKRLILSHNDVELGNYTVKDDVFNIDLLKQENIDRDFLNGIMMYKISRIIEELEDKGFKFLETDEYLLAFCDEKNIVFYATYQNAIKYYGGNVLLFFQQPYVIHGNKHVICFYSTIDECKNKKVEFPTFTDNRYLRLYNAEKDKEPAFICSMKRIAQYPELYSAVGVQNQALIDEVLLCESQDLDKPKR